MLHSAMCKPIVGGERERNGQAHRKWYQTKPKQAREKLLQLNSILQEDYPGHCGKEPTLSSSLLAVTQHPKTSSSLLDTSQLHLLFLLLLLKAHNFLFLSKVLLNPSISPSPTTTQESTSPPHTQTSTYPPSSHHPSTYPPVIIHPPTHQSSIHISTHHPIIHSITQHPSTFSASIHPPSQHPSTHHLPTNPPSIHQLGLFPHRLWNGWRFFPSSSLHMDNNKTHLINLQIISF